MELLPLVCLCLLSCSGDAVRVVVKEDSDAVLPCLISTKENLEGKLFDWKKDGQKEVFLYDAGNHYNNGLRGQDQQFKGRVSFFQDQLQNGDASIKIRRTTIADSGTYSCIFPRLQSPTSYIELVVDRVLKDRTGENIPGAAPEPYIDIKMTKDWILLQCEAHGVPPLTVEWKDGAGTILKNESAPKSQTGSPSYITLEITVTKTDNYSCVATQEDISHQIAAYTSLYIHGAAEPSVTTLKTDDGTVLQCKVRGASPKPKVEWKDSSGNRLQAEEPMETERGGSYDVVLKAAVTKTDNFRCVVTQEEISHQTEAWTYALYGSSIGTVVAAVLISLFVGFVVGALVVVFCRKRH